MPAGLVHARRGLPVALGQQVRLAHLLVVAVAQLDAGTASNVEREHEVALVLLVRLRPGGSGRRASGSRRGRGPRSGTRGSARGGDVVETAAQEQREVAAHREAHDDRLAQPLARPRAGRPAPPGGAPGCRGGPAARASPPMIGPQRTRAQAPPAGAFASPPRPAIEWDGRTGSPMHTQVAIVGSGFGGLGTAIRLQQEGLSDFVILERADDVGGTWRDNSYPGCACDVASHFYSLSFAPNPDWTDRYSRQPEIWRYLQRCADDFDLRPHIRFEHEVRVRGLGRGGGKGGASRRHKGRVTASVLVLASGPLSEPVIPDLPGLRAVRGTDVPFRALGPRVRPDRPARGRHRHRRLGGAVHPRDPAEGRAPLSVFQRTPAWVLPRLDGRIRPWQRRLFRRVPAPAAARAPRHLPQREIGAARSSAIPG